MSKHWYNNGTHQLLVEKCPEGYKEGKLPVSEETRKKMALKHKGKTPYNKGMPCKEETKLKIAQKIKQQWETGKYGDRKPKKPISSEEMEKIVQKIKTSRQGYKHSEETKMKIGKSNKGKPRRKLTPSEQAHKLQAIYNTHKKNNSFNSSKIETQYYQFLLTQFDNDDIIKQFFDKDRYPFHCDFYIKSLDLFIELNLHWTHGSRAFDKNDPKCLEQLSFWQKKALTSNYYKQAIYTWTNLDVRKRNIAETQKLNYLCYYDTTELFTEIIAT